MLNISIDGLGLTGRATLKVVLANPGLHLTAVNDIFPADTLAYLLKFEHRLWTVGQE